MTICKMGSLLRAKWLPVAIMALAATGSHAGIVYNEVGDAGELTATAQTVSGAGQLDAVRGSLAGPVRPGDLADLFVIHLTAGIVFSATTTASSLAFNNFDTTLYLFDMAGTGLFASDDDVDVGGSQSTISGFTPLLSGLYYLGISGTGYNPLSAGGQIFPSLLGGTQFGPTGPGGGDALSGWSSTSNEFGAYEIRLSGAEAVTSVPEPSGALLAGLALGAAALGRRRRCAAPLPA